MNSLKRIKRKGVPKHIDEDSNQTYARTSKKLRREGTVKDEPREGEFQCDHCHCFFDDEQQLFEHEVVHFKTEDLNVCEDCGLVFATKMSLLSHRRAKHNVKLSTKGSRFKCPDCGKTFLQKSGLGTHMTIHTGEKPFKCDVCGLGFRLNSSLQRHLCKEHYTYKAFKCEECGKEFGHNSDLMHHKRSVHSKVRPFVCQICDEKFTTNVVLMRHVNIHFDLKLNECKVCGARFSHSGSLHNHMKIHSDERAYECPSCGKSYKLKSHLKNHSCKVNSNKPSSKKSRLKDFNELEESSIECEEL